MTRKIRNISAIKEGSDSLGARIEARFQQALSLHQQGQLIQAQTIYQEILQAHPRHFGSLHFLGVAAYQAEQLVVAVALISKAISENPGVPSAHSNLALALHRLGRLDEARYSFDRALALQPESAEIWNNRGALLEDIKAPEEALASFDRALSLKPDYAQAHHNRGNALKELRRLDEAQSSFAQAISLKPDDANAYNSLGIVLMDLNRVQEALANFEKAIALKPNNPVAYNNLGNALRKLHRLDAAMVSYDRAIALKPDYAQAYNNRGNGFRDLKRHDEAVASYDQAIALNPTYAEAYNNRGIALGDLSQLDAALVSFDLAISLKPDYAEAYDSRGNGLRDLKRHDEAVASYDKALALRPNYAEAYNNRGNALRDLYQLDAALASYDRAIAVKPDFFEALNNRGNVLIDLKRASEALSSYEAALALNPTAEFLLGTVLHTRMKLSRWDGLLQSLVQLAEGISAGKKMIAPFPLLGLLDAPELQKHASITFAQAEYPKQNEVPTFNFISKRPLDGRIRVGYYSADFNDHALSALMVELLEIHRSDRFHFFGFYFGLTKHGSMHNRISSSIETFIDISNKSTQEVVNLSRELGIDIAVDLNGYTNKARTDIFIERCAPIQVNYLGYPGTMGLKCMDYLIADSIIIPENQQSNFTEKIVYLPHSYLVNDSKKKISDRVFSRTEVGLPPTGFVFCCFNNNYKILPATFDGWMRIIKAVENSVLWLLEDTPETAVNLRRQAEIRGVDGKRLVFARRLPMAEHLARHRLADLFIDTLPCNAHTTASDALWANLPVLTCMGNSFASRVAASLLTAIDLPELITNTQEEFEARAIELARDGRMLAEIRCKLALNRLTTPLFDTRRFARHIESAYELMYERHAAGLPPDTIRVCAQEPRDD